MDLNPKKKEEEEKQKLNNTEFDRDKDHEKDHYYDMVSTFFSSMIHKFLKSSHTFSNIINNYLKVIKRDIPKDLKEILREDVIILIDSRFQGSYCPNRSAFEKIPTELRKKIYSDYFDDNYLAYFDKKFFWRIVLEEHVIPFLKDFKEENYNFEKIMNEILRIVPEDTRKSIIEEYYSQNWAIILEINENEKIPSKQEKDAIIKNPADGVLIKEGFFNLSPIKKKVIIDIIWDLFFDINKRYGMSFTNELLSPNDRDKLLDIAVDQYLEAYETVEADFLDYFEGKGKKSANECPYCGGLFHDLSLHVRNCENAPNDAEAQLKNYLDQCK